jgi:hypothetical protein
MTVKWSREELASYIADAYVDASYPITIRSEDVLAALPEINIAILRAMADRESKHADCDGCSRCITRLYPVRIANPPAGRRLLSRLVCGWNRTKEQA